LPDLSKLVLRQGGMAAMLQPRWLARSKSSDAEAVVKAGQIYARSWRAIL